MITIKENKSRMYKDIDGKNIWVVDKQGNKYMITDLINYNSPVQDARKIHRIECNDDEIDTVMKNNFNAEFLREE